MKSEPFNREKQYNAKRRAVIQAAGRAFAKQGFHNSTMKEIANGLGLTKAALYYYVKNKEEILYECHLIAYDAMDDILKDNRSFGQTGLEFLEEVFGRLVELMTSEGLSLLTDVSSLKGDWQADILQRRNRIEKRVTDLVKLAMLDGSIEKRDPHMTVYFFMGALNWLNAWYQPDGRMSADDITAHFKAQLRSGIAAQNPS